MHPLTCPTRSYEWGSPSAIPEFLGHDPTGEPVAEIWLGTHPLAPSDVQTAEGFVPLAEYAGDLPYMLKVLAPVRPLSIQVHPSSAIAELGYAAEQAAGVPLDDPTRDFKDPHHKPEMVYALSEFDTLVGLRPVGEIRDLLAGLDGAVSARLTPLLGDGPLALIRELLDAPPSAAEIDEFVGACAAQLASDDVARGYATVVEIAGFCPGDPGVVVAMLLNRVTLAPGEAAFIGPGLLHAHLSGLCLEVMASSDNVMRAGLTPKRVNPQAVLKIIDADQPASPRVDPTRVGDSTLAFEPPGRLFALSITTGAEDSLPGEGRRILLCTDGEVELAAASGDALTLARGEAAFVSAEDGAIRVGGSGQVAQAYVP